MSESSRTQNSILNIITGFVGYGLNLILSFVCRMVFVRCLAEEYLGLNGLFTNILSMLSLAELGVGTAIGYALYKPLAENNKEEIASLMKFYKNAYRLIGITIGFVGICFIPFLNILVEFPDAIVENMYLLYCLYLFNTVLSYFFSYKSALLTAAQQNYLVLGINYIVVVIQNIIQIAYLVYSKNFLGYLIIQIIATFIYNVIISRVASKRFPYINSKDIKNLDDEKRRSIGKDVRSLMCYKLSGILVNNTDNIIISYFDGLINVGLLSNYTLLTNILNSLIGYIFNGMTASIGNFNATSDKDGKIRMFDIINMSNFWLYGWAAIGIFLVSSDFVRLCFGEKYILDVSVALILAVNFYMVGMQNAVLTFKTTMGLFKYGKYILFFTAALNLLLSIILGKYWGIFGILLATAIARLLTNAWYEPYAVYKFGLGLNPLIYLKKYFGYLFTLLISGAICFWICSMLNFVLIINIVIKIIICSIVPNFIFWCIYRKSSTYNNAFGMVKNVVVIVLRRFKKTK